jgi:translation initiation factor IF-2
MPTYFARTPRRRKAAVRWKATTPKLARLIGMPVKVRKKPATEEHDAQVDLFKDHIWPRLVDGAVAFAVGNGGKRHPKVAKAMKEEGVTAGVPDIFALHRRQVYFIEMKKAKGGRVRKEQKIMMARLVGAGAICAVANGLEQAISQLEAWRLLEVAVAAETEEMAA